jgi:membrane protease YdiL (CAAX protease family)
LVFVFNALIGLIYGWLFARHSLVASMLAHAGTHVGAFVVLSVLA